MVIIHTTEAVRVPRQAWRGPLHAHQRRVHAACTSANTFGLEASSSSRQVGRATASQYAASQQARRPAAALQRFDGPLPRCQRPSSALEPEPLSLMFTAGSLSTWELLRQALVLSGPVKCARARPPQVGAPHPNALRLPPASSLQA